MYEYRIEKNIANIAGQHLRIRRIRTQSGPRNGPSQEFLDLIESAEDRGLITQEQHDRLLATDLVFDGIQSFDGSSIHIAAEISITASDNDIIRAKERGGILSSVFNQETRPVVVASRIEEPQSSLAASNGVTVVLMPHE